MNIKKVLTSITTTQVSLSIKTCTHPVIHQQVLHNEVGHNRFHWGGKLVWGQHRDVTKRHEWSDELLRDIRIQTT